MVRLPPTSSVVVLKSSFAIKKWQLQKMTFPIKKNRIIGHYLKLSGVEVTNIIAVILKIEL
jgi:hypothetical protein